MSDLKELEAKYTKKKYEKSVIGIIKDTFSLGINEISKTVKTNIESPVSGKNQIGVDLEKYEESLGKIRENE